MTKLSDAVAYLVKHYPYPDELSNSRLTKLIYLADWKAALESGSQMTDIKWVYNHYGPYVPDVVNSIKKDGRFIVRSTLNAYGSPKVLVQLSDDVGDCASLSEDDRQYLEFVVEATKKKTYDDFIKLVYSTYPVVTQEKYEELDLPGLAEEYRASRGIRLSENLVVPAKGR